jgi:thiol-disulfide isomerase/thioredoxin
MQLKTDITMRFNLMRVFCFFIFLALSACSVGQEKTQFSESALADKMISLGGEEMSFGEILKHYEGKKILLDVWASWCADCVEGMPEVKEIIANNPDLVCVFLSLDKSIESWKKGIQKYEVVGEHFFVPSGWKGDFNSFIDLDWIPRYMVVDETGKITLFKATKASSKKLKEAI